MIVKCIHGLDERFCAGCSAGGSNIARTNVTEVLLCLDDLEVRATFGAVADSIDVIPQSMGELLGPRRPEASWVVSAADGRPTGYEQSEMHDDLFRSDVISTSHELLKRIVAWRRTRRSLGRT